MRSHRLLYMAQAWARRQNDMEDWQTIPDRPPFTIIDHKGRSVTCESRARALDTFSRVRAERVTDAAGTVWWNDERFSPHADFSGMEELDGREAAFRRDCEYADRMATEYEARFELFGNDWKASL